MTRKIITLYHNTKGMNGEEDIDQTLKSNDTPGDVNENTLQEQAIEQSKLENMEVHKRIKKNVT